MIIQSQFRPASGLSNPHVQTLLPFILKKAGNDQCRQQTLELADGDFLDLSWLGEPKDGRPIIVLFHGLEGSIDSHYAKTIMQALHQQGWVALLMHFRGCSRRPNRLARSYHSGETEDARYLLGWLKQTYPDSALAAVGISLGGNMLLKLQAEYGDQSPLKAAVSVCAPVQLNLCAKKLTKGLSRIYQWHLIKLLNQKLRNKAEKFDFDKLIGLSRNEIKNIKTFWQFDDRVTAPLHGFKDVHDYYARSSARQYLKDIKKPTLMIHALDDPFMQRDSVPDESALSESVELELSEHGGHIGFIAGSLRQPVFWLPQRISEYLYKYIETE
ncbi:MAG: hydrolase [Gammaproteobacteria bacterium]|nr:hydrolase [Gammaproteobacteria bacterium]